MVILVLAQIKSMTSRMHVVELFIIHASLSAVQVTFTDVGNFY